MGGLNSTVIDTSSPVTAPSPLVLWAGLLLIAFTTEFDALKLALTIVAENERLPSALSLVAESISTSAGELVRVGTFPDGGNAESPGKTWYISTSTSLMLARSVPNGSSPVNVALLMTTDCVSRKSSAVSAWIFPN